MSSMVVVSSFLLQYTTSLFMNPNRGASLKLNIHITSHRRKKHHHSKILSRLDYFGLQKSASRTNVCTYAKIVLLNTVLETTHLIFYLLI